MKEKFLISEQIFANKFKYYRYILPKFQIYIEQSYMYFKL